MVTSRLSTLSSVVTVTRTVFGSLVPASSGGAVTLTAVVWPQSRLPGGLDVGVSGFEKDRAGVDPKDTPATQPRFAPLMTSLVPPVAGPDAGVADWASGAPGGNRMNRSPAVFAEHSVTVQTSTSTWPGFCGTVEVVMAPSLATVNRCWM